MSFCIPDPSSPNISCFAFFKDKQELLKQFINCAELGLHRNSSLLFRFVFYLESNVGSVRSSRRHSGTVNNDAPETRHSARRGWRVCGGAESQRPQLSVSRSGRGGPGHLSRGLVTRRRQRQAQLCVHPAPSTPKTTDSLHRVLSLSLILLATNVIYSSAVSS